MNHEHDLLSRLVDYHDHISAPPVTVADDLQRGRRRVRRNRGALAGGVALGVVSVVTAVSLFTGEPADDRPQPAGPTGLSTPMVAPTALAEVREMGFYVEPGPGFEVTDSWQLDPELQGTSVRLADGDYIRTNNLDLNVSVYYQGESPELASTGTRESVTVNGDAGTYLEEIRPDYWQAQLAWEYAPDSWAQVNGRGLMAPPPDLRSRVLEVAEAVRSGGETVRVPVRVGTVPASLPSIATAHSLNVSRDGAEWMWWLSIDDVSIWATSRVGDECIGSDGRPQTKEFTYRGHPGCLVAGERVGLHLGDADVFFDFGPSPELPIEDMKQMLAELTIASDDPATWFDLKDALSG